MCSTCHIHGAKHQSFKMTHNALSSMYFSKGSPQLEPTTTSHKGLYLQGKAATVTHNRINK